MNKTQNSLKIYKIVTVVKILYNILVANLNIQRLVLDCVKAYAYAFTNPNYPETQFLKFFLDWVFKERKFSARQRAYVTSVVKDQMVKKLFAFDREKGFVLTDKGEKLIAKYELEGYQVARPDKWDGKYHIISFDISEQRRKIRDELRRRLKEIGLIKLQDSVWVYPYDCREIVALIKANYMVVKDVVYINADYIENDAWLKKEFGLNQ